MKKLLLALLFVVAGMVGLSEAQIIGGSCNLRGMMNVPTDTNLTLQCYNTDPNFAIKKIYWCNAHNGFTCYANYVTATSITRNGSDLTAIIPNGPDLQIGYFWQIQYCVAGQSGPNCQAGGADSGGSAAGNCFESPSKKTTTRDVNGHEWGCF